MSLLRGCHTIDHRNPKCYAMYCAAVYESEVHEFISPVQKLFWYKPFKVVGKIMCSMYLRPVELVSDRVYVISTVSSN